MASKRIDPAQVAAAVAAIQSGDAATLERLLQDEPALATTRLEGEQAGRTLLHVATDHPGHRPNIAVTVSALVAAGADVNAPFVGAHAETPLHWAASSDDAASIDALLDNGANIDAPGGSVGDGTGTPLFDATVFAQWNAARRLVERGATTSGWDEAALGLLEPLAARIPEASSDELSLWFWAACHGRQLAAAQLLHTAGADPNWAAPWDGLTPLAAAEVAAAQGDSNAAEIASWLRSLPQD